MNETDYDVVNAPSDPERGFTTWFNPTKNDMRVEVLQGPGLPFIRYAIRSGGRTRIPKQYDNAIRTKDRSGVVIGGLAPLLVPEGEELGLVHEALSGAAKLGDLEREMSAASGTTTTSFGLDVATKLKRHNDELVAQLKEQGERIADLESQSRASAKSRAS